MTTDSNNQQRDARHAVDMSPEAIRARLQKVDELRRLQEYLSRFRQTVAGSTSDHSTETTSESQ